MNGSTKMLASFPRYVEITQTPAVTGADLAALFGVEWPDLDRAKLVGGLYAVRGFADRVKIGYSRHPCDRVYHQGRPELFVAPAQVAHERVLQRYLASERVQGDWFSGPITEDFVARSRAAGQPAGERQDILESVRWFAARVSLCRTLQEKTERAH